MLPMIWMASLRAAKRRDSQRIGRRSARTALPTAAGCVSSMRLLVCGNDCVYRMHYAGEWGKFQIFRLLGGAGKKQILRCAQDDSSALCHLIFISERAKTSLTKDRCSELVEGWY